MLTRLLLALLIVTPAAAEGFAKLSFPYRGAERTYYLDMPASAKDAAPLVLLLHGSRSNGASMIQRWQDIAAREGIVLLAPDSAHTDKGWDLQDDGPDFIHDLIAAVAAAHPIDRRRIYVFGQSGGAVYALTLGMLESEYFAAIGFHAGGWRRPAEYKATAYATRKIPIGMWVGDQDEYFSKTSLHQTEHVLTEAGFPAELHILDGRRHSYMDVPADFHDRVWTFFKAHALDGPPRYADYGAH